MDDPETTMARVRQACAHLPEVEERLSHGSPSFFVRGKKNFVSAMPEGHHDNRFAHLWCAAAEGVQATLISADPAHFFRPPYVGHRGWIGVRLDRGLGDDELAELCEEAYRVVAPKALLRRLDEQS